MQAEAGTGKSRLVAELVGRAGRRGRPGRPRRGDTARRRRRRTPGGATSGPTCSASTPTRRTPDDVREAVARLDPRLVGRAPLLGPVLGLTLPDSALTASFDGELRKTSLEDLLRPAARGPGRRGRPSPWSSRTRTGSTRCRATCSTRWPGDRQRRRRAAGAHLPPRRDGPRGAARAAAATTSPTWCWRRSTREASAALVAERHRRWPAASPAPELVATVVGRAEGNAFYLEQLVDYVLAHADRADGARRPRRARAAAQPAQPGAQPDRRAAGGPAPGGQGRQRDRARVPLTAGRGGLPRPRAPRRVVHDDLVALTADPADRARGRPRPGRSRSATR